MKEDRCQCDLDSVLSGIICTSADCQQPSNQVSNDRHRQQRTPATLTDGRAQVRHAAALAAVVYDINVLVTAAAGGNSPFRSWPSPPPASGNASADCLGIIVDAAEFALWLSPYIITSTGKILAQLFKWAQPQIAAYLRAAGMAAEHSGGRIVADVPRTVHDCPGHQDNLILDLTAEVGALLIVSDDTDLLSMSPWRGTPVIEPTAFAAKMDAMRRHARRRRR